MFDIHHLPIFANYYFANSQNTNFLACQWTEKQKPQRHMKAKWFVSFQAFPDEYFPPHCSNGAYLTNIKTVQSLVEMAKNEENAIHVDDAYVTGILLKKLNRYQIWDWSNNVLNNFSDKDRLEVIASDKKLFTPQIFIASDMANHDISTLWKKVNKCHQLKCYEKIYQDSELIQFIRPELIQFEKESNYKSEL